METAGATTAPELLERETELGAIEMRIDAIAEGRGSLLIIQGRAGIGKTALIESARPLTAAVGGEFLHARGGELERELSFGVVRQLFERRVATAEPEERESLLTGAAALAEAAIGSGRDLADPAGDGNPAAAIQHGLFWLAANLCERSPLVIAVDDLHWADPPSVRWLLYLARRVADLPLALVLASRPSDSDEQGRLLAALAAEPAATLLEPSELHEEAAAEIVRTRLGPETSSRFAQACGRASGGNPFLLGELVDAIARDGIEPGDESVERIESLAPEAVSRSVLLRIAGMPSGSDALARAVAILDTRAELGSAAVLAAFESRDAARAADALRAGAILAEREELTFAHPLLRAAVYEQIPPGERSIGHRRAAELLASSAAGAEEVAAHLLLAEAGANAADIELLRRAATEALGRGAPAAAVAYLRRALAERVPEARGDLLVELTRAAWRAYDAEAFDGLAEDPVAEISADQALLDRVGADLAAWLFATGRPGESRALAERGIERERERGDADLALAHEIQLLSIFDFEPADAQARLLDHADAVEPDTATERLWLAMRAWWQHYAAAPATEAIELAERALAGGELISEHPDLPAPGQAILVLLRADALDEAAEKIELIEADAQRRGSAGAYATAAGLRSQVALRRGSVTEAVEEARRAVEISREHAIAMSLPLQCAWLVDALVEAGALDEADGELAASGLVGDLPAHFWFLPARLSRAQLRAAQGRTAEAIDDLRQLQKRALPTVYPVESALALNLAAVAKTDEAVRLADAELDRLRAWGTPAPPWRGDARPGARSRQRSDPRTRRIGRLPAPLTQPARACPRADRPGRRAAARQSPS